jgi:hypothetical protein
MVGSPTAGALQLASFLKRNDHVGFLKRCPGHMTSAIRVSSQQQLSGSPISR